MHGRSRAGVAWDGCSRLVSSFALLRCWGLVAVGEVGERDGGLKPGCLLRRLCLLADALGSRLRLVVEEKVLVAGSEVLRGLVDLVQVVQLKVPQLRGAGAVWLWRGSRALVRIARLEARGQVHAPVGHGLNKQLNSVR
eukprot:754555-Hanusia_phi.AAC.2